MRFFGLWPGRGAANISSVGQSVGVRLTRAVVAAGLVAVLLTSLMPALANAQGIPGRPASENINSPPNTLGTDSDAAMWRAIRQGAGGSVNLPADDARVLIQSEGEIWRQRHNDQLMRYGGWLIGGVVGVLLLFFLIRGRMRIEDGRTGRVIPRFTLVQRIVHWFMAVCFVILGLTGVVLLFGKVVLLPVIGHEAYAVVASASMQAHNLFGPLFIPATIALFITFLPGNFFQLADIGWLLRGGGFFGGHASSHKYNFGEKTWFWWASFAGIVLSVSGLALLFPWATPGREALQLANLAHGVAAVISISFAIGHMYLGTIGMEGALEGMTRGTVDENWAKEHHDLWYEAHKAQATDEISRAEVLAASRGDEAIQGAE